MHSQQVRRDNECWFSQLPFSFTSSWTGAPGMVLSIFRMSLPIPVNLIQIILHRPLQRLVSSVTMDPVKLTINANHHVREQRLGWKNQCRGEGQQSRPGIKGVGLESRNLQSWGKRGEVCGVGSLSQCGLLQGYWQVRYGKWMKTPRKLKLQSMWLSLFLLFEVLFCFLFFSFLFESESPSSPSWPEFAMETRLASISLRSVCPCLSSAGIKGVHQQSWLECGFYELLPWEGEPGCTVQICHPVLSTETGRSRTPDQTSLSYCARYSLRFLP